ncbi:hypothetical protein [Nonomuraea sp. NPDC049158]|uniref:hypothetical protein n=1 Tax=Nonomuraea sp. NPDC049158 TaxID=3155649 RepID=UPI0033C7BFBE
MSNEDVGQPGENILLVPVLTVEVTPDERGWLHYIEASIAIAGAGPNIGGPAALVVQGKLMGCDESAAGVLALMLHDATSITIYGSGPGMPQLLDCLRRAIAQERAWRAKKARAK